ncbi:MAG: hypothetical protein VKL59_14130 [Nostocaceae cyanobacterium]|nr:hypothetical protein [Nostocaceae cyanobacterium]
MQVYQETFSWFDVPEDVKRLLILAAENWENTAESEKYINQALAETGDNTDVFVAVYRYFYYKNNLPLALRTAEKVVEIIKNSEKFPDDWEQLKKTLVSRKEEPAIRLYLNAYAASGMVLAKLGEIEQAKEITTRVKEVDDKNEFGAALILDIITRPPDEED